MMNKRFLFHLMTAIITLIAVLTPRGVISGASSVPTDGPIIFAEHIIASDAVSANAVYSADLDDDGDTDILTASGGDDTIAWHESDGGSPPTFIPHVITSAADAANSVFAADVDGDGDLDVRSASEYGGTVIDNGDGTWSWSLGTSDGPAEDQTIIITTDDGTVESEVSFDLTVNNVAPDVGPITITPDPPVIAIGMAINASANFSDPGTGDTHIADWDWGDGWVDTIDPATSPASAGHVYTVPGVYTVKLIVSDDDGAWGESVFEYVVVYDPDGGFVTGGGWIDSPAGAYVPDPTLAGKANFGFVSKYKKGATVPTGQTEFQFRIADLNFHSSSYDWLVIAGAKAMYKGVGTINGAGAYQFLLTGLDADVNANDEFDVDRFRIKIWSEDATGNEIMVYDNGLGVDDLDDSALTEIGSGSIFIHSGK